MRSSTTPSLHMSSSFWITHRATNGSTSRFHFRTYAPSYPLQYVFWQDKWGPLCLKFITFWPWLTNWLVFLVFQLFSLIFSTMLQMQLGLPHSSIEVILWCVCTHLNNPMGIHFLCYVHGNECTGIHDPIHNIFITIAWNVGFHVGQK